MAEYAIVGVDSKEASEIEQKVISNPDATVKRYDVVKSKVKVAGRIIVTVKKPKKKVNIFTSPMIEGRLDGKEADNFLNAIPFDR